jgi:hypothetical protein
LSARFPNDVGGLQQRADAFHAKKTATLAAWSKDGSTLDN